MAGHFLERVVQLSRIRILKATVAIWHKVIEHQSGKPAGSGVLLKFQNEYFLISAAHLLNESNWDLLIMPATDGKWVTLQGELCTSYRDSDEKKDIDFAILRFYPKMHKHLTMYSPIVEQEILMNHVVNEDTRYFLAGYPIRKVKIDPNRKTAKAEALAILTSGTSKKRYIKHGFDENFHTLVSFQNKIRQPSGSARTRIGNPQGISGCGLFLIPEFSQAQIDHLTIKLIGIMIENHQHLGFMAAIRIDAVIEVLRFQFNLNNLPLPKSRIGGNLGNIFLSDYMSWVEDLEKANGIEPVQEDGVNQIMRKDHPLQ